ncbi:TonB-dependent receptor plug domain-containing protein [Pedobacter sp. LMG 31462]|uniref:TonB-dependent receptor plug domain-containing protein n=1 Tax=Pedobacter gandavensis TaxID=2679963 RepID=A0ABR6F1M6_9SPHI|nr:TonB-dependent receptor plug domain-containing protein [Pedobacter gandavensis]
MKAFIIIAFILTSATSALAQFTISGKVLNRKDRKPVEFATVSIPLSGIWTMADANGKFVLKNVPAGEVKLAVQYLGFVKMEYQYLLNKNLDVQLLMDEDNLTLDLVEINAKKGTDLATSYTMDRKALDHLQMLQVTDIASLLPGRKTNTSLHLATTAPQRISLNGTSSELGNATFGVGIEVDGVRITNNSFKDPTKSPNVGPEGPDLKNISTTNIESVEVITGLPSVEYGDMTNGMVKINSRKGVSPYLIEMSTRPNSKLVALSKGLSLGKEAGVLNFNVEHTKSISDLASPYTSYDRNSLSLNYNNTFNKNNNRPLTLNFGVTGNLGGYDSKTDPDLNADTYTKQNDNALRANFSAKWLLKLPWITSLDASGTLNYNNKLTEVRTLQSTTASQASIRTKEQGYHVGELYDNNPNAAIILIPKGIWYESEFNDNKFINYNGRLKANLAKKIGLSHNNFMLGADYSVSGNNGQGLYYDDLRYAPTWRPYPYKDESFVNNYAFFAEDALTVPLGENTLQMVAGIRSEITDIKGSEYGSISNWSPRFNAKYSFWTGKNQLFSDFSIKASWGKTVKLPGFDALYITPGYRDILAFSPGTNANGETYYAYYTQQKNRIFNPDLKWQSNEQKEIAVNFNLKGTRVYISLSDDYTRNPYQYNEDYSAYFYKFTSQTDLQGSAIPSANRIYNIDKNSGIVTVTDKTGVLPVEQLSYTDMYGFNGNGKYENGSPVSRKNINWIIDFKRIEALKTSITVDGNYYFYKGLEKTISAYMPNSTQNMADGRPYKYIGYFIGGGTAANGSINKSLNMNFTVTTHIPAIRLVVSARLEGSFYRFSKNLSESDLGTRAYVIDSKESYLPSATQQDIYGGNRFVAVYPDYYVDFGDLNHKIPFLEKFTWAKDNDVALYNELAKMVVKSNTNYYFNENKISSYYSANLAVTKEIGKYASLSFFANNFFNNMAKVRSTWSGAESSLFGSSYIPAFNYGTTLRLKF